MIALSRANFDRKYTSTMSTAAFGPCFGARIRGDHEVVDMDREGDYGSLKK